MRFQKNRILALLLAVCFVTGITPSMAYGAVKTVSSVVVRVGTDTQAGQYLNPTFNFYRESLEIQSGTYVGTNSPRYSVRDSDYHSRRSGRRNGHLSRPDPRHCRRPFKGRSG